MIKYNIEFDILGEIRMGSPYNGANVKLSGDYVPDFSSFTFQDKALISDDGRTCYLVQWDINNDDPGYIVWKIEANTRKISKSVRIKGCCESLNLKNEILQTISWNWNTTNNSEIKSETEVMFKKSLI